MRPRAVAADDVLPIFNEPETCRPAIVVDDLGARRLVAI